MIDLPDAVLDHLLTVGGDLDLGGTKYRHRGQIGEGGKIGEGGMGSVYVVDDTELDREVALKVVTGPHADALEARLRREARTIARLEHPGIVPVHDIGRLPDGRLFYVMKLVRGQTLSAWAATEPGRPALLRFFTRICEAVAFAHAHGVIHRDLKPDNIMVGTFGEALVMDWGLAKALGGPRQQTDEGLPSEAPVDDLADTLAAPESTTRHGTVMGTPAFMPPEQARGDVDAVDERSDIYALGAILYTLLAGRPPYDGPNARAVVNQVLDDDPTSLAEIDPALPRPLVSICARAMARTPADRYPTALELADDIGRFLDRLVVHAHRETWIERVARFTSRHRVLLTLLGVYLLVRMTLALFLPG